MIQFHVVKRSTNIRNGKINSVYLQIDHWNDYSFITMFHVVAFDENSKRHDLGEIKIGFKGQTESVATHSTLSSPFISLPPGYFSVGLDVDYYNKISEYFSSEYRENYLNALHDVVMEPDTLKFALNEQVFQTSLLRNLNINTIIDQFRRVLDGGKPLTDYSFRFVQDSDRRLAGYNLEFSVKASSTPTTNIHAIIGRNGVGKTTLLNSMTLAIMNEEHAASRFESFDFFEYAPIKKGYFSGLVSVSFSAFDPFTPPKEQPDPSKGTCYFYIGLKSYSEESEALLKSQDDLADELVASLGMCLSESSKRSRWLDCIRTLETDDNFSDMKLPELMDSSGEQLAKKARRLFKRVSSGHAIVLLTITKLVACVGEKTLVLFDEPESHLHPPLLSALIRCLSALLTNRNAIAVVATHSPVVLQEIPKSCVWKITRSGLSSSAQRPETETFGENVGVLTREVFGLEVSKSGFNALLAKQAAEGRSYEEILSAFGGQLGLEGRAILRSILHRAEKH